MAKKKKIVIVMRGKTRIPGISIGETAIAKDPRDMRRKIAVLKREDPWIKKKKFYAYKTTRPKLAEFQEKFRMSWDVPKKKERLKE